MTCKNCGKYNEDKAKYCVECGTKLDGYSSESQEEKPKKENGDFSLKELDSWPQWILLLISFFVPILGIIYYAIDRDRVPVRAKKCLTMSIVSLAIVIGIAISVHIVAFVLTVLI